MFSKENSLTLNFSSVNFSQSLRLIWRVSTLRKCNTRKELKKRKAANELTRQAENTKKQTEQRAKWLAKKKLNKTSCTTLTLVRTRRTRKKFAFFLKLTKKVKMCLFCQLKLHIYVERSLKYEEKNALDRDHRDTHKNLFICTSGAFIKLCAADLEQFNWEYIGYYELSGIFCAASVPSVPSAMMPLHVYVDAMVWLWLIRMASGSQTIMLADITWMLLVRVRLQLRVYANPNAAYLIFTRLRYYYIILFSSYLIRHDVPMLTLDSYCTIILFFMSVFIMARGICIDAGWLVGWGDRHRQCVAFFGWICAKAWKLYMTLNQLDTGEKKDIVGCQFHRCV